MKLPENVENVIKNKIFILESFISYFSAFWVQKLLMCFRSSLKLSFRPGRGEKRCSGALIETNDPYKWNQYIYREKRPRNEILNGNVNGMAPISEAKTCQLHQEQQQRRKTNALIFSTAPLKNFSSRCFSSWWLLITSQWLGDCMSE